MTLENLLYEISRLAIGQKIINYSAAGTDIYVLNGQTIKDWPVLFSSPTGTQYVKENSTVFTLTIYYLERMLSDLSNDVNVISVSIEQLKNLINGIKQIQGVMNVEDEYEVVGCTETEAFNDSVAGAYATIKVEVANNTICYTE